MDLNDRRILVTGALGQIGSELVPALRTRVGPDRVVASDIRMPRPDSPLSEGLFEHVDCTELRQIQDLVRRHDIGTIYHLAGVLSAVGEDWPHVAWDVNMGGLYRILEVARQNRCVLFFPELHRGFRPDDTARANPAGYAPAAADDLWDHESRWRAFV